MYNEEITWRRRKEVVYIKVERLDNNIEESRIEGLNKEFTKGWTITNYKIKL